SAALIIGMARAVPSILTEGGIIDTIVYFLGNVLGATPVFLQGIVMYWVNNVINFAITSGSGQAAATMPIIIPLSDMVGISRQTAVLAFNFGDGFSNYILPTSTALMGILGAANVPYDRWMKFMWKLFLIWLIVGSVLVFIAQMIHLGPM
ncbi:MAG: TIGR00366 family protein, partial [Synergistaceae bacterium]|nr:TIGR00366 family protein [Synergistaceae bacterium]MBP9627558.1 TIGR00366 family protein [Synergistaceae bacterium]